MLAIGESEFDGKTEAPGKNGPRENDDAVLGDSRGVTDGLRPREGSAARDDVALAVGGLEMHCVGIVSDPNIRGMKCGRAGSGIGFRDPRKWAQIR